MAILSLFHPVLICGPKSLSYSMYFRAGVLPLPLALTLALIPLSAAAAQDPLKDSSQCLIVTTDSWSSSHGTMSIFERDKDSKWRRTKSAIPIVVGRAGLGWGRGLTDTTILRGPIKKEGDDKAPAGIFRLSSVFGSQGNASTKMPYLALSPRIIAVDDRGSQFYNRLVDQNEIGKRDWRHAETMFGVDVYKWGVVVDHNTPPTPGAGSCIFLHVWKNPATPTSGCTAMSERNIVDLIRWLDPAREPRLVQLPRPVYGELRERWSLPTLP